MVTFQFLFSKNRFIRSAYNCFFWGNISNLNLNQQVTSNINPFYLNPKADLYKHVLLFFFVKKAKRIINIPKKTNHCNGINFIFNRTNQLTSKEKVHCTFENMHDVIIFDTSLLNIHRIIRISYFITRRSDHMSQWWNITYQLLCMHCKLDRNTLRNG